MKQLDTCAQHSCWVNRCILLLLSFTTTVINWIYTHIRVRCERFYWMWTRIRIVIYEIMTGSIFSAHFKNELAVFFGWKPVIKWNYTQFVYYINVNNIDVLLPNANTDLIKLSFIMVQKWQIKWDGRVKQNSTSESFTQHDIVFNSTLIFGGTDRFWFYCPYFFELI